MDADFWLRKWQRNEIGFHEGKANEQLVKHFPILGLVKESRVFLPLCGKTRDIAWLLSQGYRVAGAELSELAVKQLFAELNVVPAIADVGRLKHCRARNIDIFVGDIFHLSAEQLGPVSAVYDRAALIALPETMRRRYSKHLTSLCQRAPQLLISYEYDQNLLAGPPFSVSNQEVLQHYGDSYQTNLLYSGELPGGLKGQCAAIENVWLLR